MRVAENFSDRAMGTCWSHHSIKILNGSRVKRHERMSGSAITAFPFCQQLFLITVEQRKCPGFP
jgi:hypothetical protein